MLTLISLETFSLLETFSFAHFARNALNARGVLISFYCTHLYVSSPVSHHRGSWFFAFVHHRFLDLRLCSAISLSNSFLRRRLFNSLPFAHLFLRRRLFSSSIDHLLSDHSTRLQNARTSSCELQTRTPVMCPALLGIWC